MEFDPHGAPHNRPVLARGCAARTQDMRAKERALTLHGLVGVQLDARACISYDDVHRDALQQLRIPAQDLEVTCLRAATFLLRFAMPELRAAALRCDALRCARTRLQLKPWIHQISASAAKFMFRVRLCIEGIPPHAHQPQTIVQLFKSPTFIEEIASDQEREEERGCFCVWIWT